MLKTFGMTLLLGAAILAQPAIALEVVVTHVEKNADGTSTYHYAVKTDPGESFTPGSDFITLYNFKLIDGSTKTPDGWTFSSEEFGRTPTWHGYPVVGPVDEPMLSNLTWTASHAVAGGTQTDGFSAISRGTGVIEGEYTAQITIDAGGKSFKQAVIGQIPAPAFYQ